MVMPAEAAPVADVAIRNSGARRAFNVEFWKDLVVKTQSCDLTKSDIQRAMLTPPAVFDTPQEVVDAPGLSSSQKIEILKRWELDARALQRATEENMTGGEHSPLDEVNDALMRLDPEGKAQEEFGRAPTKL